MNRSIILALATSALLLSSTSFGCEGECPQGKAAKLQTAQIDGASRDASAKATQIALADGSACAAKKALQTASTDGSSCAAKKSVQVALADGTACKSSDKAVQVAGKTQDKSSCDRKSETVKLALNDTKASSNCSRCDKATATPAVAKTVDEPVVVAAQE